MIDLIGHSPRPRALERAEAAGAWTLERADAPVPPGLGITRCCRMVLCYYISTVSEKNN